MYNGEIAAFEALLRWEHPDTGLVMPGVFVPMLEQLGLIVPAGEWVLIEACRQLAQWRAQFPGSRDLAVNVNISARQLSSSTFLDQVRDALEQTALPASSLKLEITESLVMENPERATSILQKLSDMGVSLSIDDFGTGYSSLAYLQRLPADTIKIDKSFILNMKSEGNGLEIVRAIIILAHTLNKKVVAEGVETSQQLGMLMQQQCEYVQGYFFSKPVSGKDAETLLAHGLTR